MFLLLQVLQLLHLSDWLLRQQLPGCVLLPVPLLLPAILSAWMPRIHLYNHFRLMLLPLRLLPLIPLLRFRLFPVLRYFLPSPGIYKCNLHIPLNIRLTPSIRFRLFLPVTGNVRNPLSQAGFPLIYASSYLPQIWFHSLQGLLYKYCHFHNMSNGLHTFLLPVHHSFHLSLLVRIHHKNHLLFLLLVRFLLQLLMRYLLIRIHFRLLLHQS